MEIETQGAPVEENFAQLFEESLQSQSEVREGEVVSGTVIEIKKDTVLVDIGYKSEATVHLSEFRLVEGVRSVVVGDKLDVFVESREDDSGLVIVSKEKADKLRVWDDISAAAERDELVKGTIIARVKGGLSVDIGVKAFLPGSQVDLRPVRNLDKLLGEEFEFKIIKFNKRRGNIVLSRRALLEQEREALKSTTLERIAEGEVLPGIVKNLTDYGAFVDLGGVDGLLHITDMAWKRIKHPSEVVEVGQELDVKVLKFDRERNRVSLGLKQLGEDPWVEITNRYPEGSRVNARITNLTDYGCFAEIEEGVEGLVHVSEMDWTNKNVHPSKIVQLGDEVEVMVLDIDQERRRISLGIKQCQQNPWDAFAGEHATGDKISGSIKSITDFGIFIGLAGNIDGLVHLSDISWNETGEEAVRNYKKGDEIETVILSIDPERERISLGIKQLEEDSFTIYLGESDKGSIVNGEVTEVDAKGAVIKLNEEVDGYIKVADLSRERIEDARSVLSVGEKVEAKIIAIDRKTRSIGLSIKAKDMDDEKEAVQSLKQQDNAASPGTIGDLIKAQMNDQ